eukprot:gene22258-28829_t
METYSVQIDNVPGNIAKKARNDNDIDLSLYNEPPTEEISLDEFELYSLDRLQLLRSIEILKTRGFEGSDLISKINEVEKKYLPLNKAARKDKISHFILRLAYCRTADLRQWFLEQECSLFRARLEQLSQSTRIDFMRLNGLEYDVITEEQKNERKHKLIHLSRSDNANYSKDHERAFDETKFYIIPFQQALKLIAHRLVYLENGFAYVPHDKVEAIILSRFRLNLSHALAEAATMFEIVGSDSRIGPLLRNMNKQYVGRDYAKSSIDKLTADKVDEAADEHMPLCMKMLHSQLKRDHKLKHWGRLQYGLFLKGAGLDLEEALVFWESHFTRLISHDSFIKDYSYNFRHMYGKEGARKNYTPYSCMKIIMGPAPTPGAIHGCPYKHAPDNQLSALLSSMKISSNDTKEIMQLAKAGGHYQLACQKHFDVSHPGHQQMDLKQTESVANHPNAWYHASIQYQKLKSESKENSSMSSPSPSNDISIIHDGNSMELA